MFFFSSSKAFFQGPVCPKTIKEENSNFWPRSWFNPFKKSSMATMWNPYFYSPGGLVFVTGWPIYLVTCWLHDILIYLSNWDIDVLTEYLSDLLTLTLFTACNWINDLSWLYGSWWIAWLLVYFLFYLLWTLWCKPNLPCIAQIARGVGTSFWRHELWDRMSNSQ